MTEDQAKTKWCPYARVMTQGWNGMGPAAGNRLAEGKKIGTPVGSNCLASACMAWREWSPELLSDTTPPHVIRLARGYCGLAGRPE